MNIETRSRNRKRTRPSTTDLNSSIPHLLPKVPRKMNRNIENYNEPQFVDLSHTINTRSLSLGGTSHQDNVIAQPNHSTTQSENITPEVRDMVADEAMLVQRTLEEKVRKMVQDEVSEIKKNITDLTHTMYNLLRISRGTSESRNSAGDNPPADENRLHPRNPSDQFSDNSIPTDNINTRTPYVRGIAPAPTGNSLEQIRIRIDKLGVVFDGNSAHTGVEDFIFRLEHLQRQYQLPWAEILRDFHLLVSGSAREWYWGLILAVVYDRILTREFEFFLTFGVLLVVIE